MSLFFVYGVRVCMLRNCGRGKEFSKVPCICMWGCRRLPHFLFYSLYLNFFFSFLWLGCLFWYWVVWFLYIFEYINSPMPFPPTRLSPYKFTYALITYAIFKFLLPFGRLPFCFVGGFRHCAKSFLVLFDPICLILLLSMPEET